MAWLTAVMPTGNEIKRKGPPPDWPFLATGKREGERERVTERKKARERWSGPWATVNPDLPHRPARIKSMVAFHINNRSLSDRVIFREGGGSGDAARWPEPRTAGSWSSQLATASFWWVRRGPAKSYQSRPNTLVCVLLLLCGRPWSTPKPNQIWNKITVKKIRAKFRRIKPFHDW